MYVISLDHYLDERGAIAITQGPGRKIAEFAASAVAYASNAFKPGNSVPPACFKCKKYTPGSVDIGITSDGLVVWRCNACGTSGQISNWRGTFWDLSEASSE